MIQQLAGLGYVALFVSRLVGLTLSRQMSSSPASGSVELSERHPGNE